MIVGVASSSGVVIEATVGVAGAVVSITIASDVPTVAVRLDKSASLPASS